MIENDTDDYLDIYELGALDEEERNKIYGDIYANEDMSDDAIEDAILDQASDELFCELAQEMNSEGEEV